jgi:hypothetical protein
MRSSGGSSFEAESVKGQMNRLKLEPDGLFLF